MITIDRFTDLLTRRTALGLAGSAVLVGGLLGRDDTDDDGVSISIDDSCTSASIEMQPPGGETWTGAVEFVDGESNVVRRPSGGQTVSGGGTAVLEVSMDSPGTSVQRAYVVEGSDLDGSVVAEKACGSTGGDSAEAASEGDDREADDVSDSDDGSGTSAWAVNVGGDGDSEAVAVAVSEEEEGDEVVVSDDS